MVISTVGKALRKRRLLCIGIALASSSALYAAPMAYKGGIMFMSEYSADDVELGANYAVTARDAFGAMFAKQTGSTGLRRTTQHATYTRLAKRWNLPAAQANIWLMGNVEQVRGDGLVGSVTAWEPGIQVDYETTRVYAAATWHSQRAAGANDALVRHNAMSISDHRWNSDVTRLAKVVAIDIPGSAAERTLQWLRVVISIALFAAVTMTTGVVCWKWFVGKGAELGRID